MADNFPPKVQRPAILAFAEIVDTRPRALLRDECGDWRISGKYGCVYAVPVASGVGYQLTVMPDIDDARPWNVAKRKLAFAKVTQNGDSEGGLILARLPTAAEGATIRKVLGIPKRKHLSPEARARLRYNSRYLVSESDIPTGPLPHHLEDA